MNRRKQWISILFILTTMMSVSFLPVMAKHNTIVINVKSSTGEQVKEGTSLALKQPTGPDPTLTYNVRVDDHGRVIFRIYERYFDLDEPIEVYIMRAKLGTFYLSKNYSAKLTVNFP